MQTTTVYPTLQIGSRGPAVIDLQRLLNDRFAPNPVGGVINRLDEDGFYGPKTEDAVRIAQFRYLLPQDGIAGPLTWASLQAHAAQIDELPLLRRGSRGAYVVVLQKTLDPVQVGPADGDFGLRTEAAVKAFQTGSNITSDGVVGSDTWKVLEGRASAQLV